MALTAGTMRGRRRWQIAGKARMKNAMDRDSISIEALVAVIACSPIVMARPAPRLPNGFGDVDLAILDWIAADGRRIGRDFTLT
jgi:hypothetical protein